MPEPPILKAFSRIKKECEKAGLEGPEFKVGSPLSPINGEDFIALFFGEASASLKLTVAMIIEDFELGNAVTFCDHELGLFKVAYFASHSTDLGAIAYKAYNNIVMIKLLNLSNGEWITGGMSLEDAQLSYESFGKAIEEAKRYRMNNE